VALLEKEDFGYGTVSRSTRLIHGGLRYLELFDFGLVREGLREREILLRTAPHLVHPLAFFTPVYKNSRVGVPKLRVGMWLYDLLSWDKSLPRHRFLNREEAAAAEPLLTTEGLRGAFVYYDGHVPMPERLCLEAALQAAAHGAVIVNHARAEKLQRTGDLYLVTARDELTARTYEVRAKSVINATGPWADEVNDRLVGAAQPELRRTKGIHLLVPKLSRHAVVMLAESDGRLFFAIPWGDYTYIGTTDTDFSGDLDRVRAEREEFEYLIRETKRVFPGADVGRVHFSTAGVRPLVRDPRARHEGQVSRKHRVKHHEDEGYPGYFSVLGGKITNMRAVAEETVDKAVRFLKAQVKPCTTREALFPGGMHPDMDRFKEELAGRYGAHGFAGKPSTTWWTSTAPWRRKCSTWPCRSRSWPGPSGRASPTSGRSSRSASGGSGRTRRPTFCCGAAPWACAPAWRSGSRRKWPGGWAGISSAPTRKWPPTWPPTSRPWR